MKATIGFKLLLLLSLLLWAACPPAGASAETLLTPDLYSQFWGQIYQNRIVWQDSRHGGWEVYLYDISTNTEQRITNDLVNQSYPTMWGEKIIWSEYNGNNWNAFLYDISNGTKSQISTTGNVHTVDISDHIAVWSAQTDSTNNNSYDIFMYDMGTQTETRITSDPLHKQLYPVVSGDRVVWQDMRSGSLIYYYDANSGTERRLSAVTSWQVTPDIDGDRVVWGDYRNGKYDIYMYDFATGIESRVTTSPGNKYEPSIHDNRIVWIDDRNGNNDIYMYDILTGTESEVSTDAGNQWNPNIWGNIVVWTDYRHSGRTEIYMTEALPVNMPPVAIAGDDQSFHVGVPVTLDGGGSSDPEKNYPLDYAWSFVTVPSGSTATLSNPGDAVTTFTPDYLGDYTLELVVTDSLGLASSPDTVLISTTNTPPVADADDDIETGPSESEVALNGTLSYDLEGDPISYAWSIVQQPAASTAWLSDPSSPEPTLSFSGRGTYVIELVASDPWESGEPDQVVVSSGNIAPKASAGPRQSALLGETVYFNGGDSFDPNGDVLTYSWSIVSAPEGSTASLLDADTIAPNLTPDLEGVYVLSLVVSDGALTGRPDDTNVNVVFEEGLDPDLVEAMGRTRAAMHKAGTIPEDKFKNPKLRKTLSGKLSGVLTKVQQGAKQQKQRDTTGNGTGPDPDVVVEEADNVLSKDVRPKMDGHEKGASADKDDWVTEKQSQDEIRQKVDAIRESIERYRSRPRP